MLATLLWPFLVNYLILFAACYIITEYGQNYLYDESTPALGLKIGVGTAILAGLLTWTRTNFLTMFTDEIIWTTLQAIVWFAVFTLIFRFQPWHAAGIGLPAMLILTGLATLAVDSMLAPKPAETTATRTLNKPIRRPIGPVTAPAPAPAK
ncbi:hypothetical protein TA3x_004019 [Tundrisphaera sp. TA3]|uniref:hypothetical protein n=1 Tax=Tundrisphaera sp. TA3 TaxID=3435775 RepID=UPI003EC1059A